MRLASFDRLQGMDGVVGYAVVAILCKLGWEPLGGFEFRKRYGSPNP